VKLAEALAERGDLTRRVEHLKSRILTNARHQEGESPAEDAAALLVELEKVLDRLEVLVRRNQSNEYRCATGRREHHGRTGPPGHAAHPAPGGVRRRGCRLRS